MYLYMSHTILMSSLHRFSLILEDFYHLLQDSTEYSNVHTHALSLSLSSPPLIIKYVVQ